MTVTASRRRAALGFPVLRRPESPWAALSAMLVGFFMILVDSTIVAVANPSIMTALRIADYDTVVWFTSAYLLGYAVPLLLAGRLGDSYGVRALYLTGLAIFTASSLWCGLSDSVGMLIAARVVQGVGAALITPQTLSTITRIFPPERRGVALSVWGATAGVAALVGPLAGGLLVGFGWQWIFFVNVPIGIVGLALAAWLVPSLPTRRHGIDGVGVVLSAVAMFAVVFALQEGHAHDWAPWIWATIGGGLVTLAVFVRHQATMTGEPLVPLRIFADRAFTLSTVGIATIGFVITAMVVPLLFFAPLVAGLSPLRAALLLAPMAVASAVLAPVVGRLVDRVHPTPLVGSGFAALAVALTWLSAEMTATTPIWRLAVPMTVIGAAMAFIWSPLAAGATRHLPIDAAGAGSGVYNAIRQLGSVLGSATMASFMASQTARAVGGGGGAAPDDQAGRLPAPLRDPFAVAFSQSMLLPAGVALVGVVAALLMARGARIAPPPPRSASPDTSPPSSSASAPDPAPTDAEGLDPFDDTYVVYTRPSAADRAGASAAAAAPAVAAAAPAAPMLLQDAAPADDDTEPLATRAEFRAPRPVPIRFDPPSLEDDPRLTLHHEPLPERTWPAPATAHPPTMRPDLQAPVGRHARPD